MSNFHAFNAQVPDLVGGRLVEIDRRARAHRGQDAQVLTMCRRHHPARLDQRDQPRPVNSRQRLAHDRQRLEQLVLLPPHVPVLPLGSDAAPMP